MFAGVNSHHLGSYTAIVVMPEVFARKGTEGQIGIPQDFCLFLFDLHDNTVIVAPFAFQFAFYVLESFEPHLEEAIFLCS